MKRFLFLLVLSGPLWTFAATPEKITICRLPLTSLAPHGILVRWSSNGSPRWNLDQQPGTPLTVGGRPAREQIRGRSKLSSTICGSIGADGLVAIHIPLAFVIFGLTIWITGRAVRLNRS